MEEQNKKLKDYISYRICQDITILEEYLVGNQTYKDVINIISEKEKVINILEEINNGKLKDLYNKVYNLAINKFNSDYEYREKISRLIEKENEDKV